MKLVKARDIEYIPASHEDPKDPSVLKKILLSKEDLIKGTVMMVNWAKLLPGKSFESHYHEDMDEVFVLTEGMARIRVGDETALMEKGDAVIIPMRQVHKMTNPGSKDVEYVAFGISRGKNGKAVITK